MTNINLDTIENRIKEYQLELAVLRQNHDQMVAVKQQQDQEFQQRVAANQNRYQQLTGALAELDLLLKESGGEVKPPVNDEPAKRKRKPAVEEVNRMV